MIQNNSIVITVGVTEQTLLNIVDNADQPRCFWFQNLDDINSMILKFQTSVDGGSTWVDLVPDGDTQAAFVVPNQSSVFKKITNSNMLRLRGSGEGLLHVGITRHYPNDAVTIRI